MLSIDALFSYSCMAYIEETINTSAQVQIQLTFFLKRKFLGFHAVDWFQLTFF